MIFVTVGLSNFGFERLIKKMDSISEQISEEVIMQIGASEYEPKNTKFFRFASREEIDKNYEDARIIVSHAGIGSLINCVKRGYKPIIVPRSSDYNEAFDNHQLEISKEFLNQNLVYVASPETIVNYISLDSESFILKSKKKQEKLIINLKNYISSLNKR